MQNYSTGEGLSQGGTSGARSRRQAPAKQGQRLLCPKERRVDRRPNGRCAGLDPVERSGFSHGSSSCPLRESGGVCRPLGVQPSTER
jgi:hypothetical protein